MDKAEYKKEIYNIETIYVYDELIRIYKGNLLETTSIKVKLSEVKILSLYCVSKSLPTIIEIDFDGHLKCQIETTDKAPTILKAVNGYGQPVDCNKDKIRINEIQAMFANGFR